MNSCAPIRAAGSDVVRRNGRQRDLRPFAHSMAKILISEGVVFADERAVEAAVRRYVPIDMHDEVSLLVDMCPDIARGVLAAEQAILPSSI